MHGHSILINYIRENKIKIKGKTVVEIGSVREMDLESQNSTYHLGKFCQDHGAKFISVDMDPDCTQNARNILKAINLDFKTVNQKGEDFLKGYKGSVDVIYLDAFDYYHSGHSERRKQAYSNYLHTEITNENSWKMHLECCVQLVKKLSPSGIICFDDILNPKTYEGKGKLAIPYLLDHGFAIKRYQKHGMILQRV